MQIIEITDLKSIIDQRRDYCTLIGLNLDSFDEYLEYIKTLTKMKHDRIYYVLGKTMNDYLELTGNNRYSDDLLLAMIDLDDIKSISSLIRSKYEYGTRWFSDIVYNNLDREDKDIIYYASDYKEDEE